MKKRILSLFGLFLGTLWLASCSSVGPSGSYENMAAPLGASSRAAESQASAGAASDAAVAVAPRKIERPGLGTAWGENQRSEVTTSSFERASASPAGVASLYYNDETGAKAMADHSGFRWKSDGRASSSDGSVTLSLKSGFRTLKGFAAQGKEFVVGESGQKYAILVSNNTAQKLEVVVSVDGLDVMDGRTAAYSKRGYILQPNGSVTIKGFRRSTSEVAAFRFSSVSDSYASLKHGDTRNVGVIGAAVFREKSPAEVNRRFAAEPFASPPN